MRGGLGRSEVLRSLRVRRETRVTLREGVARRRDSEGVVGFPDSEEFCGEKVSMS
jgi:hypothetical protein